jgi:serine/threonine-protein kinase HipA
VYKRQESDGEYILKPSVTGDFVHMSSMPSNEHLTMQLARQVFGLHTAENALVFFRNGDTAAYLTKRFDVKSDGSKLLQEDFAQIAQVSEESGGKSYKYNYSYEKIAALIKAHVSTYAFEVEKFFKTIVFNYLIHNGDAHLKNFSLYFNEALKAYTLTPAYDLLNTRLHLPHESALALDMFESGFESESYQKNGYYAYDDFYEFGIRIGMLPARIERFLSEFVSRADTMKSLIDISFIETPLKSLYATMIDERINALGYSYRKSLPIN